LTFVATMLLRTFLRLWLELRIENKLFIYRLLYIKSEKITTLSLSLFKKNVGKLGMKICNTTIITFSIKYVSVTLVASAWPYFVLLVWVFGGLYWYGVDAVAAAS